MTKKETRKLAQEFLDSKHIFSLQTLSLAKALLEALDREEELLKEIRMMTLRQGNTEAPKVKKAPRKFPIAMDRFSTMVSDDGPDDDNDGNGGDAA